jgi:hypothetical protein
MYTKKRNNYKGKQIYKNKKQNHSTKRKHVYTVKRSGKRSDKRSKKGGEVITSGGFGCIFKPALKCKDSKKRKDGVSKMSINEYSSQELKEVLRIQNKLKHIPNYDKLYLLKDIQRCEPEKLTQTDLVNFDKKCSALTKYNINEQNVNDNLDKLKIINMPYGGISLRKWLLEGGTINVDKIKQLNQMVVHLLKNAIVPMNNNLVIHNDLKDQNVLVDSELNTRIIDWGLAAVVKNNAIPDEVWNRPLQFNTPFSAMIFTDRFKKAYTDFLLAVRNKDEEFNENSVRNFVITEYVSSGHKYFGDYDNNTKIFSIIFKNSTSSSNPVGGSKKNRNRNSSPSPSSNGENTITSSGHTLYYLSNYITSILMEYTDSKYFFHMTDYFMKGYLHNSDVFGIMTTYYTFFNKERINLDIHENKYSQFLNQLRNILVDFIFTNGSSRINTEKLCDEIILLSTNFL